MSEFLFSLSFFSSLVGLFDGSIGILDWMSVLNFSNCEKVSLSLVLIGIHHTPAGLNNFGRFEWWLVLALKIIQLTNTWLFNNNRQYFVAYNVHIVSSKSYVTGIGLNKKMLLPSNHIKCTYNEHQMHLFNFYARCRPGECYFMPGMERVLKKCN